MFLSLAALGKCFQRLNCFQSVLLRLKRKKSSSTRTLQGKQTVWKLAAVNIVKNTRSVSEDHQFPHMDLHEHSCTATGCAVIVEKHQKNSTSLIDALKAQTTLSIVGKISALWGVSKHHKKSWYRFYVDV